MVAVSVSLAGTSFAAEVKYKKKTLYKEGAAGGGSIAGVVSLKGKAPPPIMEDLKKGKNVEFCTKHPDTVKDGFRPRVKVTAAGGKLKDAVVFIESIATGKPWGDKAGKMNFDFRNCDIDQKIGVIRRTSEEEKKAAQRRWSMEYYYRNRAVLQAKARQRYRRKRTMELKEKQRKELYGE